MSISPLYQGARLLIHVHTPFTQFQFQFHNFNSFLLKEINVYIFKDFINYKTCAVILVQKGNFFFCQMTAILPQQANVNPSILLYICKNQMYGGPIFLLVAKQLRTVKMAY